MQSIFLNNMYNLLPKECYLCNKSNFINTKIKLLHMLSKDFTVQLFKNSSD